MEWLATKKVLVVDDNDMLLVQKLTEKTWIQPQNIMTAQNGIQAVERAIKEMFDVIIMDIRMPEMDGITASKKIKSHYGENAPKIIAYTALDMKADRKLFAEIINKPMSQKGFSEKLLAVLNG